MLPLTMAKYGDTNCIKKITGNDNLRRRLTELGFVTGEPVTVISKMDGNMILLIKGTRVALDKNMTRRIMV